MTKAAKTKKSKNFNEQLKPLVQLLPMIEKDWDKRGIRNPGRYWTREERNEVGRAIERLLFVKLVKGPLGVRELKDLADRRYAVAYHTVATLNRNREKILAGLVLAKQ